MSVITDLRVALADELAPLLGVDVHAQWPDVLTPPCAYISPPLVDDYVRRGPTFREHTVALDLIVLVEHGDPATSLAALDALIEIAVVNTADWSLSGVDSPAPIQVSDGGAEYLASVIHLRKAVQL